MRVLKWLAYLILAVVVGVAALLGAARLHDGPLEIIPGGPFESGELVTAPVDDWSFATDIPTIELQLEGDDTSRTVWILVDQGVGYVPCSLGFPPFKTWHRRADRDGRAVLRIDGRLYRVNMQRVDDAEVSARLGAEVRRKYGGGPPSDAAVWFFVLASRP